MKAKGKVATDNASSAIGGASSRSVLSGKEKVQMLKMMKEKQREAHSVSECSSRGNVYGSVPNSANRALAPPVAPAGFFDDEAPSITLSTTHSRPAPQQQPPIIKSKTGTVSKPDAVTNSSLPVGFFDDISEDLAAHGTSLAKQSAVMEEHAQQELQSLMQEVTALQDDDGNDNEGGVTAVMAQAELMATQENDADEEVMQYVYMAKLAGLMTKGGTRNIVDHGARATLSSAEALAEIEGILRRTQYDELEKIPIDGSDHNHTAISSTASTDDGRGITDNDLQSMLRMRAALDQATIKRKAKAAALIASLQQKNQQQGRPQNPDENNKRRRTCSDSIINSDNSSSNNNSHSNSDAHKDNEDSEEEERDEGSDGFCSSDGDADDEEVEAYDPLSFTSWG